MAIASGCCFANHFPPIGDFEEARTVEEDEGKGYVIEDRDAGHPGDHTPGGAAG